MFGGGSDLQVANNSNSSYIGFPCSYSITTGTVNNTFTDAYNVTSSDIEFYKLV